MNSNADETLARCAAEAASNTRDWSKICLAFCRIMWGISSPVFATAMRAWVGSAQQGGFPPPGAPVYWTDIIRLSVGGGPLEEAGHVAIADSEPGWCWSIDIQRPGKVDRVPLDLIRTKWGGTYLGWTSDLEQQVLPLEPSRSGATVMLAPGARIAADAAFPPAAASLLGGGYQVLFSYLSSPERQDKNWSWAELTDCRREGLYVGMFAEQAAETVLTGASEANLQLGRVAESMADKYGYPDDCPIWFAVDVNAAGQFDKVFGAFRAYRQTNRRPLGIYGGSQIIEAVMDAGLAEYGHIAAAVSWSQTATPVDNETVFFFRTGTNADGSPKGFNYYLTPRAHMRQYPSIAFAGSRIDPNDVKQPIPVWDLNGTDDPPVIQEDDMPAYFTNDQPYPSFPGAAAPPFDGTPADHWPPGWVYWAIEANPHRTAPTDLSGAKRWVNAPAEANALGAQFLAGRIIVPRLSTGDIQAMPDYVPATGAGTVDLSGVTAQLDALSAQIDAIPAPPSPAPYSVTLTGTASPS